MNVASKLFGKKGVGWRGTMPMFLWSELVANVIDAIETLTEFTSVRKFIR